MSLYVKLTTKDCCHNGLQFVEGLNTDPVEFYPYGACHEGGIYFIEQAYIHKWLEYNGKIMYWIWDVDIPLGARFHDEGNKMKANKINLSNKRTITQFFVENPNICLDALANSKYALKQRLNKIGLHRSI